jgi:hypothetical protein
MAANNALIRILYNDEAAATASNHIDAHIY